jgi:hypothetical protein
MGAYQFDQYDADEQAREISRGCGIDVKIKMQKRQEILKNVRASIYAGVYIATASEWAKIGETRSVLRRLDRQCLSTPQTRRLETSEAVA